MGKARIHHIKAVGIMTMAAFTAVTVAFGVYVAAAVFKKNRNLEPTGGEVSLRSYFQKGSGTQEDPFVISRPIHFYNFSRLQNLGVFSSKRHFVLGYDPAHPDDAYGQEEGTDLTFYKDNSSNTLVGDHVLDMESIYSLTDSIAAIGDEGSPFYGDFNGQGLGIRNLRISSQPDDVGVFGYTAPGSKVSNVFLINPKVTDDGFETDTEIAPLFINPDNYSGTVTWNNGQSVHEAGSEPLSSTLNNSEVSFADTDPKVNITAALPNLPASMPSVTCEYRLSCDLLSLPSVSGGTYTDLIFNKGKVTIGDDEYDGQYRAFATCDDGGTFHVRLSLVASSVTNGGIHYTKTLNTYLIVLTRHVDGLGNASFTYQITKDQYDGQTVGYTQYRHCTNIGLLCGHAEGSFHRCFVYGGTLSVNNYRSNILPLVHESDTGLIGEIGASSDSSISPQSNYEGDKDTGVLNFSKMYEDIAGGKHTVVSGTTYYSYTPGEHNETFIANGSSNDFRLSYEPESESAVTSVKVNGSNKGYTLNGSIITISGNTLAENAVVTVYYKSDSADKFMSYLRNNQLSGDYLFYATKYSNTLDFIGQRVIEDTETDKRKGMGVFSLVTTATPSDTNSNFAINELGDFVIKKDDTAQSEMTFSDFYYTTAEWNADPDGDGHPTYEDISGWSDVMDSEYHINQPYSFPTGITPKTWNPYFERYFNYNIHCDLSANSTMNNYFFNTESEFLKNYFAYKLVNSSGVAPAYNTPPFGVFVRNINPDTGNETPITKFDSALEVKEESGNVFSSLQAPYTETFVGNGIDKSFDLKHAPVSVTSLTVDGNSTNAYSIESNVITFNDAPGDTSPISITYKYKAPTKSVVFSIKNSGGANVTLFAASTSENENGSYVGIYDTSRGDLYTGNNITSKPDYAMYCPYYTGTDSLERGHFHSYSYDYSSGATPLTATDSQNLVQNRLYAHTFYLKQGEYLVSSPEGTAKLVYLCAQGQNGKGNTGLSQPNGLETIEDIDFIGQDSDPKKALRIDSDGKVLNSTDQNIRCYLSFNSAWDDSSTATAGNNDFIVVTGLSNGKPTVDINAGGNLTYLLIDNEGRYSCSFNGDPFERQFYEYVRPTS
ncbi:MAG: hypothetical protein K6G74_00045 [Bacilli bacterium]|nr:hypothetical protein [Bacilli bacterium]